MRLLSMVLVLSACEGVVGDLSTAQEPSRERLPSDAGSDAGNAAGGRPDERSNDGGSSNSASDAGSGGGGPGDAGGSSVVDAGLHLDAGIDAGTSSTDAGQPGPDAGLRDVLVAQGRLGRTMLSCDDGRTWVNDRDEAQGAQCGDPPLVECFHHAWASMGLVHTGTSVVATWGWGAPGRVRRTTDGVVWEDVLVGTSFGAITAGAQVVLGASGPPQRSFMDGQRTTWTMGGALHTGSVTRHAAFLSAGAGRFFIALDDALKASDDAGGTWRDVTIPSTCLQGMRGLVGNDRTLLVVGWNGGLCTSTDRGQTWSTHQLAAGFTSNGVFAQGAFWLWNGATRYRSADGLTWTSAQGTPSDVSIGAVTVTRSGTFVAFKGGWQSEYSYERIYRSTDGLTWQTLPASAHPHSHPITHLIAGPLRTSSVCP